MKTTLKGHALAREYCRRHPLTEDNPGKTWASYDGGGWITLRGQGLLAHLALRQYYPQGWALLQRVRSSRARSELNTNFAKLRRKYAAAGWPRKD